MQTWNKVYLSMLVLVLIGIIYLLSPILTPFLVGALLAYLVNPLVQTLIRWHVPRLLSVSMVFLLLFTVLTLLVIMIIPVIQRQMVTLSVLFADSIAWLQQTVLPQLKQYMGSAELVDTASLKQTLTDNWTKAGGIVTWVVKTMLHSSATVIEWTTRLMLIPVVTFYLLRDWNKVLKALENLLPRKIAPTIVTLVRESDEVLSAFFRGQLMVMLALGVIYSVGLSLVGLQVGVLLGMIAGLASIVPYLGLIVGVAIGGIAAYLQFGTLTAVLSVFAVFAVGQMIEGTLLTPNLVGHRIGLHPVAVIFAVLTGATLFGFFGVLLALPVAAVLMVWLRFFMQQYRHSSLYL